MCVLRANPVIHDILCANSDSDSRHRFPPFSSRRRRKCVHRAHSALSREAAHRSNRIFVARSDRGSRSRRRPRERAESARQDNLTTVSKAVSRKAVSITHITRATTPVRAAGTPAGAAGAALAAPPRRRQRRRARARRVPLRVRVR